MSRFDKLEENNEERIKNLCEIIFFTASSQISKSKKSSRKIKQRV